MTDEQWKKLNDVKTNIKDLEIILRLCTDKGMSHSMINKICRVVPNFKDVVKHRLDAEKLKFKGM